MSSKVSEELDRKRQEQEQLFNNRYKLFVEVMGDDWPKDDIFTLVDSDVTWHDVKKLLEKGCPKDQILKILL